MFKNPWKKCGIGLVGIFLVAIFAGCTNSESGQTDEHSENSASSEALLEQPWEKTEAAAENSQVNLYMWGGDEGVNRYIDNWVAPRLKENYDITLKRYPMDITEVLQKLQTEKRANKETGVMDIIWINGENFKNAKENGLLWNSFSDKLPNFKKFIGQDRADLQTDFGTPVEGMEAPWGKVQYVFFYDAAHIKKPPQNFIELAQWVKENPGKFTYPEVQDFTGSGFMKHLLYDKMGRDVLENELYREELTNEHGDAVWQYLNDIQPYLWKNGENYPASLTELDRLYSQGEVWMTMGYNEARAERLIEDGTFPETTKSFIMEPGSIGNYHFLSIPFNSPNKAGAMVAINELLSPEAQLEKMQPSVWGENTPLSLEKLSEADQEKFKNIERGDSVLPSEQLEAAYLNEMDPAYTEWLKENWMSEVVQTTH
ncbi:ABC transporter substrate-binding protein [Bacillus piscicola]|uniref:ABC transporter substrate-binding protein n=1 Tax=Bacillus piscicola TaxID=1632684 RepID=UPI001F09FD5C|nr:ABC transporter substrate-binding protein [Bacillus piscicola]